VFHEIQNTGRHLERLLRKKVSGICTHVSAKVASHTLRIQGNRILKRAGLESGNRYPNQL
jgi:hypothetical protein